MRAPVKVNCSIQETRFSYSVYMLSTTHGSAKQGKKKDEAQAQAAYTINDVKG